MITKRLNPSLTANERTNPMDDVTREALEGSIKKWEAIVDGSGIDAGPQNCPLCQMFWAGGCRGCPVFDVTDEKDCYGTPYWDVDEDAPERELKFLKSLRPSPAPPSEDRS